jgi:hypothetical protein
MFGVVSRNFVAARHPFRKRVLGCIQSTSFCHWINFFVFHNEHAQSTTLGPKHMFGVVSRNFVVARHPFQKRVSGCIQARVFATGTISSFFATNMPNPLISVQTHVWGGFAQFRCRTSPIPKMGVGVHTSTSLCHRNHFFVFRNEHSQSTTLGPKLMFGVVSRNFVAVCNPIQKRVSGCIQSTSFCHRINFFVFRNGHAQSTTLGPKHMFGVISCNFVAARHPFRKRLSGCIHAQVFATGTVSSFFATNRPTLGPKHMFGVVSHNFVAARHPFRKRVSGYIQSTSFCHRNHFFLFRNEHAQSTTLGPKLILGWFRAISLSHVAHSENGCGGAYKDEFLPPEPFLRFSQRTCPIH